MGRVGVVGGGPAGLTAALLIEGSDVTVFEEHGGFGVPRHCTSLVGLWTARFFASLVGKGVVSRSYREFVVRSRAWELPIRAKRPIAFYIERPDLEERLAERAESKGHRLLTGVRAKPCGPSCVSAGGAEYRFDAVVAADGAQSVFRESLAGVKGRHVIGVQALVRGSGFGEEIHVFIFGFNHLIFGWFVPLDMDSGIAGFVAKRPVPAPQKVIEKLALWAGAGSARLEGLFGGLAPAGEPLRRPIAGGTYFLGDSALMVKPYTFGGLYYVASLAPALARAIDWGDPGAYLEAYERALRRHALERAAVMAFERRRWALALPAALESMAGLLEPADYDSHLRVAAKAPALLALFPLALAEGFAYRRGERPGGV